MVKVVGGGGGGGVVSTRQQYNTVQSQFPLSNGATDGQKGKLAIRAPKSESNPFEVRAEITDPRLLSGGRSSNILWIGIEYLLSVHKI